MKRRTIVIVGGGAAGMMAAISASGEDNNVILLEANEKLGKKLFITGKGRCNVTTACPPEDFLANVCSNPRFLYSSFARFSNEDMIHFLEKAGLKLKTERGQRVFPVSDKSADVIDTLKRECRKKGVRVHLNSKVESLKMNEKGSVVCGVVLESGDEIGADAVILACGGKSYPSTGSDGNGYALAIQAGHSLREPEPSLVPFIMEESWCRDLMGLTLKNVSMSLKIDKKTIYQGFGEFLFTHFGVSGPLVLTASTCLGRYGRQLKQGKIRLILDLKPALDPDQLDKRFLRDFDMFRNKNLSNVMEGLLPRKMVPVFLEISGMDGEKKVRDISKKDRRRMVEIMKALPMHLKGVRGFEEAIVTRGGVKTKEVDPATMESKLVGGLYFAGEMLDLDAVTGGFNLQIAWSTGYAAGCAAGGH